MSPGKQFCAPESLTIFYSERHGIEMQQCLDGRELRLSFNCVEGGGKQSVEEFAGDS